MTRSTLLLLFALFACPFDRVVGQTPNHLQKPFEILKRTYPNVEAKRFVRAPADSAWLFRAQSGAVGSVEVAFQGDRVVYMIFRRGVGGLSWKKEEIHGLHDIYCKDLLHEPRCGKFYNAALAPPINAAIITRKDFDAKALLSGM